MGKRAIQSLLLLLPLLAACSGNGFLPDEPATEERDSLVTVAFRFTIPTAAAAFTRNEWTDAGGTWNDGEETEWENYINIPDEDYRFYVLDADKRFLFNLSTTTTGVESVVLDHLESPTSDTYEVRSRLQPDVAAGMRNGFMILMLANWRYGTEGLSGTYETLQSYNSGFDNGYPVFTVGNNVQNDTFQKHLYRWDHTKPLSATHTLPMYGVLSITSEQAKGLLPGEFFSCNQYSILYLLRALTKIEVCLAPALRDGGMKITKCVMRNHIPLGFYNPWINSGTKVYLDSYYTKFNDGSIWLHACNNSNDSFTSYIDTTNDMEFHYSPDGYTAYIYMPEYKNCTESGYNANGREATITQFQLTYNNATHEMTKLQKKLSELATDDTGKFNDLKRNHIYRIIINSITADGDVDYTLNYTVCRWDEKTAGDITFN